MAEEKNTKRSRRGNGPINIYYFTKLAGFTSTEQQYLYHYLYKGAKVELPREKVKVLIDMIKKETVVITKDLTLLAKKGK